MSKEITISPEGLEVANVYLQCNDIRSTASELGIPANRVSEILSQAEVKRYIDNVFLDTGYRNRDKLGEVLDKLIDDKLYELQEAEISTKADILDLLKVAIKFRQDEAKIQQEEGKRGTVVNVGIGSPYGEGNYGDLMQKLLEDA